MATGLTLQGAIHLCAKLAGNRDYSSPFRIIKVKLVSSTRENFDQSTAPDGAPWLPLKQARARNVGAIRKLRRLGKSLGGINVRYLGGKPLQDSGRLYNSISGGADHLASITARSLLVGTNVSYAAVHQFGSTKKNIPARPFMGFKPDDLSFIQNVIADFEVEQFKHG